MIALVSHDAGGAEILSSHAARHARDFVYVLEGPARTIFERKLGPIEALPLEVAICQSASILCGTSWQSDLEFNAIVMARSLGKRSVAFLDHWVNYRERFIRSGETNLPDEFWVGDSFAEAVAGKVFPGLPIRIVENPYFEDVRRDLAAVVAMRPRDTERLCVLYVCEPIRDHALRMFGDERHRAYVEEEALRFFLSNVGALGKPVQRILIRPHPSEPADKYRWVRREFDLPIEMGGTRTLVEEVAESDVVVGCESMAMVVGLLAGKRVVSCVPPGGQPCALPQPEIDHYHRLLRCQ